MAPKWPHFCAMYGITDEQINMVLNSDLVGRSDVVGLFPAGSFEISIDEYQGRALTPTKEDFLKQGYRSKLVLVIPIAYDYVGKLNNLRRTENHSALLVINQISRKAL